MVSFRDLCFLFNKKGDAAKAYKNGPKAWCEKARDFILCRQTGDFDTESSSTPSSGQDEAVQKRLIVRDLSDTRVLGEDEAKRLSKRTANAFLRISRFVHGLFLVQIFHLLITYQSFWNPLQAGIWFGFIGFSVGCGMAFSKTVRVIATLVLPMLCTSSGRSILISFSMMMVLTGPLNNIFHNYGEMSRSVLCTNELGFNITQGLRAKIQEKQFQVLDNLDNTIDVIISVVEGAKEIYENIAEKIKGISLALKKINLHLGVVSLICSEDSSSYICNLPGNIAKSMKKLITEPVKTSVEIIKKLFSLGINFEHKLEFKANVSKTSKEIMSGIKKEVKDKFGAINDVLYWTRVVTALSTLLLIYKAAKYRKKYLTRNDFDNCYITSLFKHLDKKSGKHGRPTTLPLRFKEMKKYVSPYRIWMSREEIKKCFKGWLFVTINLIWSGSLMLVDWSMYSSMKRLTEMFSMNSTSIFEDLSKASQKTDAFSSASAVFSAFFSLNVFGKGFVPAIYRAVVRALQSITRKEGLDIQIDKCLPTPIKPDLWRFLVIFCILQSCYILVYIQAYMLRLRRYIMSKHHPTRERERIIYLRRKILNNRGIGNVEDLKNTLRSAGNTVEKNQARSKWSCRARLIKWSNRPGIKGKIARKLTGRDKNVCSLCKFSGTSKENDRFTKCRRPGCGIKYCNPCFEDLHRICPSCLMRHSREKQRIRRLSRILGIEPTVETNSQGGIKDFVDDFVPSSGISDSSDEGDPARGKTTSATEEDLRELKQEADDTLRIIAESSSITGKFDLPTDGTDEEDRASTSALQPAALDIQAPEANASVEFVSENFATPSTSKRRSREQKKSKLRKIKSRDAEVARESESDLDLR